MRLSAYLLADARSQIRPGLGERPRGTCDALRCGERGELRRQGGKALSDEVRLGLVS